MSLIALELKLSTWKFGVAAARLSGRVVKPQEASLRVCKAFVSRRARKARRRRSS
jgi:hypothetical protein